jgi:gamma-glutamylputrescine oxidase
VKATRTYYEAFAPDLQAFPPLDEDLRVDACVIGAGFTGLGAALRLAELGLSTAVLEKGRVGSGASGRNGGQIHTGLRRDQIQLEQKFGLSTAQRLWDLGQAALAHLDGLISRYDIDCDRRAGLIYADHRQRFVADSHAYARHLRTRYGYEKAEPLDAAKLQELVRSKSYFGGMLDHGGGHLDPLKLVRGMAAAAAGRGVRIFEATQALALEQGSPARIRTGGGTVTADWVIVAGDSLMHGLLADVDERILPIASTVGATKPLGSWLRDFLTTDMAVADSRFVVNYFRPTPDGRVLFGGGESYSNTPVDDPAKLVRRAMRSVFPDLADVAMDYCWSGIVGVTSTRLPLVKRYGSNVLLSAGYSGQGVALAPFAGALLAEATSGRAGNLDLLSRLPVPAFPGGASLRQPLMVAAMLYYALRDRF